MSKFNPRDIPGRAHYDRLMTWASNVLGRDAEMTADIQGVLTERAREALKGDDDEAKIAAVLAEIGFFAVIDSMAQTIEDANPGDAP